MRSVGDQRATTAHSSKNLVKSQGAGEFTPSDYNNSSKLVGF
jgi:hypothetical protein